MDLPYLLDPPCGDKKRPERHAFNVLLRSCPERVTILSSDELNEKVDPSHRMAQA
jgi:hypothetical protein